MTTPKKKPFTVMELNLVRRASSDPRFQEICDKIETHAKKGK